MSYAIDELAPVMWIFIIIFILVLVAGILHFGYQWIMMDPCRAYNMASRVFGPVGDHCVR